MSSSHPTKYPQVSVVVPKMESNKSPQNPAAMQVGNTGGNISNSNTHPASNGTSNPLANTAAAAQPTTNLNSMTNTTEMRGSLHNNADVEQAIELPREISDAETQLVASLATLQKMESMIHHLRTLLPDRLLAPLAPIVNPKAIAAGHPLPKSPQMLYEQLAQTAREGVDEVKEFQDLWRSADMSNMWELVNGQIRENGGQMLQPTGVWDRDYAALREGLKSSEEVRQDAARVAEEERAREEIGKLEGGWRGVIERFMGVSDAGVVRVLPKESGKEQDGMKVVLVKVGMSFDVTAVSSGDGVPEWQVSSRATMPGQTVTKVQKGVVDCLNSRPRKWDLAYLLDMISAYANIKQTPCAKCNRMTDTAANLPFIRQQIPSQGENQPPTWAAYHPTCV